MIKPNLPQRRGPLPSARFPIQRTVVESGLAINHTVERDQPVSCIRCGGGFRINAMTTALSRSAIDDMPYVHCPHCGYTAAVLYYFNQLPKPKKIRDPEEYAVKIIKPEA